MSYNEIALQKASKQHKSELAAKEAEIAALREALEQAVDLLYGPAWDSLRGQHALVAKLREALGAGR